MFKELITRIKTQQDNLKETISLLRPDILKFQQQFVEGLSSFITQAEASGITGVKPFDKKEYENGVIEYNLQIAEQNLILVMNDGIGKLDPKNKNIGNFSFIYLNDSDNATPFIQICVFRNDYEKMMYSISWFPNREEKPISGNLPLEDDSGEMAVSQFLHFMYSGDQYLIEYPTLKEFHMDTSQKRRLGFLP